MIEGSPGVHAERARALRELRSRIPKLPDPLEIVAEQILGLESRIDFVARDRRGQVVLVFLADRGSDLGLLADSLAQRAWMEPRVADWVKLAPQLGLRPLGVRVLLLASHLDPRTVAAAKSLEGPVIDLGICRPVPNGAAGRNPDRRPGGASAGLGPRRGADRLAVPNRTPRGRVRRLSAAPPPRGAPCRTKFVAR